MIKRTPLTFTIKDEDYNNFKLTSKELIRKKVFRSQIEIMECFINFLMIAEPEELIKLKTAGINKEELTK